MGPGQIRRSLFGDSDPVTRHMAEAEDREHSESEQKTQKRQQSDSAAIMALRGEVNELREMVERQDEMLIGLSKSPR
jgi:hypothetical protein